LDFDGAWLAWAGYAPPVCLDICQFMAVPGFHRHSKREDIMRIALLIQYDGSNYHGWQIQRDDLTVQGVFETALKKMYGMPIGLMGSGRTDSGVHALGQVAHFDVDHSAVPPEKVWMALNQMLPQDIRIMASAQVDPDFHSRFNARERTYQYRISTRQNVLQRNIRWYVRYSLKTDLLEEAAQLILGKHDFSSFCYAGTETTNMTCQVQEASWYMDREGELMFQVKADRFLHHMVRMLVGCMIEVARGKWEMSDFHHLLKSPNRQAHVVTAPPNGLALVQVNYLEDMQPQWNQAKQELSRSN
jgi:tRNA pseudouridine38-40 synthase